MLFNGRGGSGEEQRSGIRQTAGHRREGSVSRQSLSYGEVTDLCRSAVRFPVLPGVFRYGNPQNRVHVTEKPLQLMKDVVQICEPGGRILDPFAGAGTTILAAAQQGYQAVGIEVTDAYFQLGTERVREALKEEVDVQ